MDAARTGPRPFFLWRHLNKLRWLTLVVVFAMLVAIPLLHLYQTDAIARDYDLMTPAQQQFFDVMEALTAPFMARPETALDAVKGSTWTGIFAGYQISDPLAVLGQSAAGLGFYLPFVLTALIPVIATLVLGRIFCGWICPATLIYELNSNLAALLKWAGLNPGHRHFDMRLKYGFLVAGLGLSMIFGVVLVARIYPPAIIGREIYYAIALGGFGGGSAFFAATMLFDLLVARRGFCRYVCPGGALYSLLGRYRLVRIRRLVEACDDCAKCNAVCEFGLNPLRDDFGQECNNCTACMAVCPTEAMTFILRPSDVAAQGPGHLGRKFQSDGKAT